MPGPHAFFPTVLTLVPSNERLVADDKPPTLGKFSATIVRARDLLVLDFEFVNLKLAPPGVLVPVNYDHPAYIVAYFQSQNLIEEAFEDPSQLLPDAPDVPVKSQLAPPSRLIFGGRLDKPIQFSVSGLLEFMRNRPMVQLPPSTTEPTTGTSIRLPLGLALRPGEATGWNHLTTDPSATAGRSELWHTRLGVRGQGAINEQTSLNRTGRAFFEGWRADTFSSGLDKTNLQNIAELSQQQLERPIQFNRLTLSALGASLDARLERDESSKAFKLSTDPQLIEKPPSKDLIEWQHRTTLGRDHAVRVVYAGYLFPLGHQAAHLEITERKFARAPDGSLVASLFTRQLIVVRQATKTYSDTNGLTATDANQSVLVGRQWPFAEATITTRSTPVLDVPKWLNEAQIAFWPKVDGKEFLFHVQAVDRAGESGNRVEFTLPLIFVQDGTDPKTMHAVAETYRQNNSARQLRLDGQRVAYVPSNSEGGDMSLETTSILLDALVPDLPPAGELAFSPAVARADVGIPAIKQLFGQPADPTTNTYPPTTITYHPVYLSPSSPANPAGVFAKFLTVLPLQVPPEQAGGLVAPTMRLNGLSSTHGPIADADTLASGKFNPMAFFDSDAMLLGNIALRELVPELVAPELAVPGNHVPTLTVQNITVDQKPAVQVGMGWVVNPNTTTGVFRAKEDTLLTLSTTITHLIDEPTGARFRTTGTLSGFSLDLLDLVIVDFTSLRFDSASGQKLQVDPKIAGVEFRGALAFVSTLAQYLPSAGKGFEDPPFLDVAPEGVDVGYTLGIPTIAIGMMSLQHVGLTADLFLPLQSGSWTTLRFLFAERHKPFLLTVGIFGGGGFFGIAAGTNGIERVEAALEFGAAVALNLGLASGAASVMAGIYFSYNLEKPKPSIFLSGYLRCSSALEVLGIVSISVEFLLGLEYPFPENTDSKKVGGRAVLLVKVKVLFFSKEVALEMERKFAGSAGDPSFGDVVPQEDWQTYCAAFDPDA